MTQEIVFILDRSGSMKGSEAVTIGGYNSFLKRQQSEEGTALVTTVLFDDRYELLHDAIDIHSVVPITTEEYFTRGSTALLDAVGSTIDRVGNRAPEKAIFVIITDGRENASREYTYTQINSIIKEKQQEGWEFIYLGADLSDLQDAERLGIRHNRRASFDKGQTHEVYGHMSDNISEYRKGRSMPTDWDKSIKKGQPLSHKHNSQTIQGLNNLPLMHLGSGYALIDTGSPISFGDDTRLRICSDTYVLRPNPLLTEIQEYLSYDIKAVIGMDILRQYDIRLTHSLDTQVFHISYHDLACLGTGEGTPLRYIMGIPAIDTVVNGRTASLLIDTGSTLTYISEELTAGLAIGAREDFYPVLGKFTAKIYATHISLLGKDFKLHAGVLPGVLGYLLPYGIKGIIGTDVLMQQPIWLAFKTGFCRVN